jgi:hypothetical protein
MQIANYHSRYSMNRVDIQIDENAVKSIKKAWEYYAEEDNVVTDTKGNELPNIDERRLKAIEEIKQILEQFIDNSINIHEFKTSLDSYNKRNNLWGFTSIKGQMFFNQLTKNNEERIDELTTLLKRTIKEPSDLTDALTKIEDLEKFVLVKFNSADDKRKVANPKSIGYFLSYFWQIHNWEKWPIMYTSQINSFKELEIWDNFDSQSDEYEYFYFLNEEVKDILQEYTESKVSNWEVEHAFWNYNGNPYEESKSDSKKKNYCSRGQ